jgi:hypothetical protein
MENGGFIVFSGLLNFTPSVYWVACGNILQMFVAISKNWLTLGKIKNDDERYRYSRL